MPGLDRVSDYYLILVSIALLYFYVLLRLAKCA